MKLLSLWEPWATLMAVGAKRIETRGWKTWYRGWLAIHASKGGLAKSQLRECLSDSIFTEALRSVELKPGHIVAVVKLVEVAPTEKTERLMGVFEYYKELDTARERTFGDYQPGRFGWVTEDHFRLPSPIPYKASQGLCDVQPEALKEIRRQWMDGRR